MYNAGKVGQLGTLGLVAPTSSRADLSGISDHLAASPTGGPLTDRPDLVQCRLEKVL